MHLIYMCCVLFCLPMPHSITVMVVNTEAYYALMPCDA